MIRVVGIDPGARWSGLVVRDGQQLLYHEIVENDGPDVTNDYLRDVLLGLSRAVYTAGTDTLIGLEGVAHPNPHVRLTNVEALLGTAEVVGAIRVQYLNERLVVVPPGGHGSAPLRSYPAALVGAREKGVYGTGRMRHLRSAWDVAGATKQTALLAR